MKHENYEILNLLGYGLAKFDKSFVACMGYQSKHSLYKYLVGLKVAESTGVIKNRQDLFDPFFDNDRKGWWQKKDDYIHRKYLIDSYFGNLKVEEYCDVIRYRLKLDFNAEILTSISPLLSTKFRRMQETGSEAEEYFIYNYKSINLFQNGKLEDARLYGDGYDFQIAVDDSFYLTEVKGVRKKSGSIRLTEREHFQAKEFKEKYVLTIVCNLDEYPKFITISDPLQKINFEKRIITSKNSYTYNAKI